MLDTDRKEKKLHYSKIVIVVYDEKTDIVPFEVGQEKEATEFFERAFNRWEAYLCKVEKGPIKI